MGLPIKNSTNPSLKFKNCFKKYDLFFTDGSKISDDKFVSAASFSPKQNKSIKIKLPHDSLIFTAEAVAIKYTILYILNNKVQKSFMFSDSLSVQMAINKVFTRESSYLIYDIKKLILEAKANNLTLRFVWIPSHHSISGNEMSDKLAKEATKNFQYLNIKLPYSDLFKRFKDKCKNR